MKKNEYEQLRLDHQLCFPLYAASRAVTQKYTPILKPLGLTYTQYLVMLVLWEQDGLRVSELCEKLFLDSGTVTPLLKKMEQQGLLTRERSGSDERVVIVHLTEKGMDLREKAKNIPSEIGSCIALSVEEAGVLYTLLYKLMNQK